MDIPFLKACRFNCQRCKLHQRIWIEWNLQSKTRGVTDVGNAEILFFGANQTRIKLMSCLPHFLPTGSIYHPRSDSRILKESDGDHAGHGLRTPNQAFFHRNPKFLGLGRQIGQINFGAFSTDLSAPILVLWVSCPCFPLNQPLFLQKTKPLYSNPNYLFGIGIWIWAATN